MRRIYFAAAAAEVCTYIALRDNAAALSGVVRRGGKPLRATFGYFSWSRKVTRVRADSPKIVLSRNAALGNSGLGAESPNAILSSTAVIAEKKKYQKVSESL